MEVKKKEHRIFPILCGLLVLMACCFRTGAVLKEEGTGSHGEEGEPETYFFFREGEEGHDSDNGNGSGYGNFSDPGAYELHGEGDSWTQGADTGGSWNGGTGNGSNDNIATGSQDSGTPGTGNENSGTAGTGTQTDTGTGGYRSPHSEGETAGLSYEDIDNRRGVSFDLDALLNKNLTLDMGEGPLVLILHTHGSEAYTGTEGYRSEAPGENVIRVGQAMADALNAAGIPTLHDTTAYDLVAGYNVAYETAAEAISAHLEAHPGIQVIIDVHRDGVSDGSGGQKAVSADLWGQPAAGLMLVMGTDTPELPHEGWQDNLAFALKLQSYIEGKVPGLMRKLSLRGARYNEHFTSCSILLEVGSAGNTLEEAIRSGAFFGEKLGELLRALIREEAVTP